MKTTIKVSTTMLAITLVFFACKKKDETPPPATTTTTGSAPVLNTMTAKVDNVDWSMANSPFTGAFISKFGNTYSFGGQNSLNNPFTSINLGFMYGTGTYTIGTSVGAFASFKDTANVYFNANSGTITVSQMDTLPQNQGILNKFKATFSFITNTVSGKSYTVTNGSIDYDKTR